MKRHSIDPVTAVAAANAAAGIVQTIASLFGGDDDGPAVTLGQASPELQAWFADTGGSQFAEYLTTAKPEAFGWTVEQVLPLFWAWLFTSGRSIGWWTRGGRTMAALRDPRAYRAGLTEQAYAAMGVNYELSAANWLSNEYHGTGGGTRWVGWVMLPGGGTPEVPSVGSEAAQDNPVGLPPPPSQGKRMEISTGGMIAIGALILAVVIFGRG